jgi:hypothetical protein
LNQTLPLQLNHDVVCRWHWSSDEFGGNWAHGLRLSLLFLWLFLLDWLFFFWVVHFFAVFVYYLFLLDNNHGFWLGRRWLQRRKCFFISVNVE